MNATEAMALVQGADALIDRAIALDNPGDCLAQWLNGSTTWFSGAAGGGDIALPVPRDADFYGQFLCVFLASRRVDQTDPLGNASDQAFRPATWVAVNNSYSVSSDPGELQDANATFTLTDTFNGPYVGGQQGMGINVGSAFSGKWGLGPVATELLFTSWSGGLPFWVPYRLRRGSTAVVSVRSTFSRTENTTVRTEFKATAVFSGYRLIRRPM